MTQPGWLRVPRAVVDSAWYREADPFTRSLWLLLLSRARFRSGKADGGLQLRPGQVLTSWKNVAEEMAWSERGRRLTPPIAKCRRAAEFLRNAGEATWVATGRPAYTGLVITLERWALYACEAEHAADVPTDLATDRLPEERQDQKKDYRSAEWQPAKGKSQGNSADATMRRAAAARRIREEQDLAELREIRARERGERVP
jgi:hypothetical protein